MVPCDADAAHAQKKKRQEVIVNRFANASFMIGTAVRYVMAARIMGI